MLVLAIDAAIICPNDKAYFFKGNTYIRYDRKTDKADAGYPVNISDRWPGLYWTDIDTAIMYPNGKIYFFKGSQYMRYDYLKDCVDQSPITISDGWHGLYWSNIDAAFVNPSKTKVYFLKGSQYMRYDIANDCVDSGYPREISSGWPTLPYTSNIDAILEWPRDDIASGWDLKYRMNRLPGESIYWDTKTGVTFNPFNGDIESFYSSYARLPGEKYYYKTGSGFSYFDPAIYGQFAPKQASLNSYVVSDNSSGFTIYVGSTIFGGTIAGAGGSVNLYLSYNKNTRQWTLSSGQVITVGEVVGYDTSAKFHIGYINGNESTIKGFSVNQGGTCMIGSITVGMVPDASAWSAEFSLVLGPSISYTTSTSYTFTQKIPVFNYR